ncbi:diguanylate cyclase [Acidicapsa dinghuensis]|uniref:Diguanylate cyclase n=1 Tax=Acidicapsa dinghuensis TaxID=2218256 RepID=A0ABW1EKU1_9BACT|nr:ligand-binding sensor domain-containing diguanylate cyclase [Acidicapsa dinghuensis]
MIRPYSLFRTTLFALIALAPVLFAVCVSAQERTYRQYGPSDGLANLGINCLFQDHIGYLWVGTDNGLYRYDGSAFQSFGHTEGIEDTEIRSVAEAPNGDLWVATQGGMARRSGSRFQSVDVGAKGLFLAVAFDDAGHLYLEHTSGILRGTPDGRGNYQFTRVVSGSVGGMLIRGEDVWFRRDGDLWKLSGDSLERVGSPAGLPSDLWGAIAFDAAGNLWVRSPSHLYERPKGESRFVDRSEGVPNAQSIRLFADVHGRLFVSTVAGVVIFEGSKRIYLDPAHGLPSDVAGPVLLDRQDSLWIGMRGGGLLRRLGQGQWVSWRKSDGLLNDSVWSMMHDHANRLWVGTSGGLSIFGPDGKVEHTYSSHNGLAGDNVFAITASPAGDVFVGTAPAGVSRFDAEGKFLGTYAAAAGLKADQVNALLIDRNGILWIAAASGGCFRSTAPVDGRNPIRFEHVAVPGIAADDYFYDIHADRQGRLWMATSRGAVSFDGSRWKVITKADGLKASDLVSVVPHNGDLWIAYRDALGLARIQFNGDRISIKSYTQQDGLSSDLIYALAFDHLGSLWVTTDNGVSVLDQDRWIRYGTEDGLIWDDGNDHAIYIDDDRGVWLGTGRGLSLFHEPPYKIPPRPPVAVITSAIGESQEYQLTENPKLEYAQNSLLLQFSALNFATETRTHFRYRLLGSKGSWIDTTQRSVHFEGLPPGDYVFEVIAAGPNGLWSTTSAKFAFTIRRPWWLRWWFFILCALAIFTLVNAIIRYRVGRLIAQKELLERQVAERTAELQESHRRLEEIAYHDALTTLPNRRMFTDEFRSLVSLAKRHRQVFALLLVDLDTFKEINDSYGHDAGDAVLMQTANLLRASVRESDRVARLGGDEFAVLLIWPADTAGIYTVAQRIVSAFASGLPFRGSTLQVTCSIGVAEFLSDSDDQEGLYKCADLALYDAKNAGGNQWRRYHEELTAERPSA